MAGPVIDLDGQLIINFASNDYLGLAGDPRLAQAATEAISLYGTGSTGSRLLSGHRPIHRELECAIASLKKTEDAIVFSSGYLANLGTISALVGSRDLILGDQYNHSSLRNGAQLSGAKTLSYPHGDIGSLERLLNEYRHNYRRCLIISDAVFSMDGDLCPLPDILELADSFESMVLIDEAHGTGVLGERGSGCVEYLNCENRPLIQIGTLSKALGSLGGFVAGSAKLVDYLRNRSPTWIYTTGLSPADTAAAFKAIEIIQNEPQRRLRLRQNIATLQEYLEEDSRSSDWPVGWRAIPSESPIICIEFENAAAVMRGGQLLLDQGIFVSAIRPPTAPTSRLRITLSAAHTASHLKLLKQGISQLANSISEKQRGM